MGEKGTRGDSRGARAPRGMGGTGGMRRNRAPWLAQASKPSQPYCARSPQHPTPHLHAPRPQRAVDACRNKHALEAAGGLVIAPVSHLSKPLDGGALGVGMAGAADGPGRE